VKLHLRRPDNPYPDDLTLRDRVTSELFGDPKVPKGDLNIDVVNRVVELRGQVANTEAIAAIIDKVRAIPHVEDVHSYLHLPGTPAPNKAKVLAEF
jgi:osmotically-inducible protein OsmY